MAIAIGKKSEEAVFNLYKGIGAFNVVAVNPNAKKIKELTGRELEEDPTYLSKTEEGITQMRVTLYLKTDPEAKTNNGHNVIIPTTFFLTQEDYVGQASGKTQVIDMYGRTAWATPEELESKSIPMYSNGPANIDANYRKAFRGEDMLIDFLIKWLNIPNPANYKNGTWVMKEDASDSKVSLDMAKIFKGNVSEIKELIELAPNYCVKGATGVRTVEVDGGTREYQAIYSRMFLKNSITNYDKLQKEIDASQANKAIPDTVYSVEPLHINEVEATTFSSGDDPLGANNTPANTPWL